MNAKKILKTDKSINNVSLGEKSWIEKSGLWPNDGQTEEECESYLNLFKLF